MIKEAITSIMEAEKEAENIIKEANIKAHKIVADAKKYQSIHQANEKNRLSEEAEKQYKQAEAEGDIQAQGIFKECQKEIESISHISGKNAEKAKDYIKRRLFEI